MKRLILIAIFLSFHLAAKAQVTPVGRVGEFMNVGRVVDWKEITADSLPFTKPGVPFSIFLTPKSPSNTTEVEIVQLRAYQGNLTREVPLSINQWNVISAIFFPIQTVNTSLFTNYRIFLGFGQQSQ